MINIYICADNAKKAFALEAAKAFAENDKLTTYSDSGTIEKGEYFAIRWGLDRNCVVVFKIDEFEEPINYMELITTFKRV